ncbi:MAG: methyltransferase domain-containing protein [Desulfurobacteriaceae bacterium]
MRENSYQDKYEWNAEDYARHSASQKKWAKELIDKMNLKGHEWVLDIGCGDGKVTAEIARHVPKGRVVGIDISEEMIAFASQKFPTSQYPNLIFIRMDASALSFREKFDIVFSNAVLHWITNHKPVLKGIYQALKPNGKCIVQMGGKGNAASVIETLDEIINERPWKEYFHDFSFPYGFYSPEEYKPWLEEAGFKIQYLELKPKIMVHEDIEEFKGWIRTTWLPYLCRIPKKLRNRFIETVAQRYVEKYPPSNDGKIKTLMQRLEFIVTK